MFAKIVAFLTSIVAIWKYLIKRRQQAWTWFVKWRKSRREKQVDSAVNSGNVKRVSNILKSIRNAREKRQRES